MIISTLTLPNIIKINTEKKRDYMQCNNKNSNFSSLELLSNYNIAFSGASSKVAKEVYIISQDKDPIKCKSAVEAADIIEYIPDVIYKALRDENKLLKGMRVIYASEIETEENGEKHIDTKKLATAQNRLNKLLLEKNRKPICMIIDDKVEQRFDTIKDVSQTLGLPYNQVNEAISGKRKLNGAYFSWTANIETKNENGEWIIDKEKLEDYKKSVDFNSNKPSEMQIYLISENGKPIKFNTQTDAAKFLGVSVSAISRVYRGINRSVKKMIVVKATDVETPDEDGNWILNEKKLEQQKILYSQK